MKRDTAGKGEREKLFDCAKPRFAAIEFEPSTLPLTSVYLQCSNACTLPRSSTLPGPERGDQEVLPKPSRSPRHLDERGLGLTRLEYVRYIDIYSWSVSTEWQCCGLVLLRKLRNFGHTPVQEKNKKRQCYDRRSTTSRNYVETM